MKDFNSKLFPKLGHFYNRTIYIGCQEVSLGSTWLVLDKSRRRRGGGSPGWRKGVGG